MEKQEVVNLAVGEQATIVCDGAVAVALRVGTVEIDGALMAPEVQYRFRTNAHRRITLYSLSGGAFAVYSTSPFIVHKAAATLPNLLAVVKSCGRKPVARVVVIGDARSGKSVAAKMIMNSLLRAHAGDADSKHVFVEGDYSNGLVCSSGFISAAECHPPALALESPFLETVPISFFVGHVNPSTAEAGKDLIALAQCVDSGDWLLRRGEHRTRHMVIDTPQAPQGVDPKWFTRQILDVTRPTHVVALSSNEDNFNWVRDELSRFGQEVQFTLLRPTVPEVLRVTTLDSKSGETSIAEYFCGQLSQKLACAAVVAEANVVHFVRVTRSTDDAPLSAVPVDPETLEPGTVVGVSHAQTLEEVPFANVAGLLVVKDVCIAENEVAFFAPESDMIPRAYLIVGEELHCRPHLLAPFAI